MLLLAPSGLRLLPPLRKIEGFFCACAPPVWGKKKSAALAGRIANRKQVTMQIIQPLHRKGLRRLFTLSLLAPLALGLAGADPNQTSPASTSSPPPASTTTATQPAGTAKPAAQAKTQAASTAAKTSTPGTAKPQPAVTQLPTIVVTAATRNTQPVDTTATTTTVLTHQDLVDNNYASVPDALQSVPGMSVVVSGMPGGQTSAFIHGLDARQTLVMIDGRRQAVGLSGADDNLANLTLDNVDQIEVVRTPITSAQGGSAMGGVINLVTLSGKGLTTPQSSVSEEMGSFNTFRENAQSRGAVGNFDYAVSASRQDSIYPALSTGSVPYPGGLFPGFTGQADQYRNTAYRGNFGYQITPAVYVDLHTAYNNAYTSLTNEFVYPDPTGNLLIEDWNLSPEIVAKVTDFYTAKFYYTHDQQRQATVEPYQIYLALYGPYAPYNPQGNLTRLQIDTDTIDWQNDFQITRDWTITAGVQGDNRNYHEFDNYLGMYLLDGHDNNLGGYISSQWQPLPGLNILNSGRYDSYSAFGGAFSWRQGASYRIAPTQTLIHASVSSAFTPPSIQDLYITYGGFPAFLPNPNLQPETDLGWEAGVEQPFLDGCVTPSATYFHNSVKNDIQNVYQPATFNYMEENFNQVATEGVEVGLALKPCSTVTTAINYTYLNAVNDTSMMRLVRRPRNSLDFTGTWNPIAPLALTMGGNWVVGRQDLDAITGAQEPAPDYFVLRASATYQINKNVSIWVRGENLTDRNYQPVLGYFAPSIAGYGGIKISF